LNSVIFKQQNQVKQVAICKKSKVLINTTKQQNQTNFCLLKKKNVMNVMF